MARATRAWLRPYIGAIVAVFLAWLLRWLLDDALGERFPYHTFLLANIAIAWWAGPGPSLMITVIGALVTVDCFTEPRSAFVIGSLPDRLGLLLYLTVSVVSALFVRAVRRSGRSVGAHMAAILDRQMRLEEELATHLEAEASVKLAEEQLRMILDSVPALISYVDGEGRYRLNNRSYELWFGHERTEITGKHLREVLGEPAFEKIRPYMETVLSGTEVSYESVVPYKDAGTRCIRANYVPQRNKAGEVLGFVALVQDITERKQVEKALEESMARFRDLMETTSEGIWLLDSDARITFANEQMGEMLGYPPGELVGRAMWDNVHAEDRGDARELFERRRSGIIEQTPVRLMHRDGRTVWCMMAARPLEDEAGEFQGALDMFTDVSDRKRAEEALRESEERLCLVMQATNDAIWDLDMRTGEVWRNEAYEDLFGHAPPDRREQFQWWLEHIHPEDRERVLATFRNTVDQGLSRWDGEYRFRRVDGAYAEVLDRGYVARDEQGRAFRAVGAMQDFTERKRMEAALRASEERLRLAAEGAHVGFWFWDIPSDRLEWTPVCKRLFGIPPEREVSYARFLDLLVPEDRARVEALGERVLAHGEDFAAEYRTRWPDGTIHWIFSMGRLACAPDGAPLGLSGVAIDLTERKQAEEALREADRRKDEFLATLAHELRNPLAPICNAVQILSTVAPAGESLRWARDVIERQVQQMSRLVDDLLDVSRITRGKIQLRLERIDVVAAVRSALEISEPLIERAGHELMIHLPSEPVWVAGDLTRLAQVLANLLNNAAKYTEECGHIWLDLTREGEQAMIRVRDDGIGISVDALPTIFGMFTQVNRALGRAQGGLGIGLTLVQQLVEMHGGTVEAHSAGPGLGSEFVVRLPLYAAAAAGRTPEEEPRESMEQWTVEQKRAEQQTVEQHEGEPQRLRPCRVLVVDDNEDAADTLAMLLQARGNEVRTAYSGKQAIAVAGSFVPDAVLLDIGLPDISGHEVARRMRQQPALAHALLVAQTGWGQDADRRQSREAGFDHHLVKPVEMAQILELLPRPGSAPE